MPNKKFGFPAPTKQTPPRGLEVSLRSAEIMEVGLDSASLQSVIAPCDPPYSVGSHKRGSILALAPPPITRKPT